MRAYEFEAETNKLRNDGLRSLCLRSWPHQNSRLEVKKHDLQVAVKKPENLKSQIRFEEKNKKNYVEVKKQKQKSSGCEFDLEYDNLEKR